MLLCIDIRLSRLSACRWIEPPLSVLAAAADGGGVVQRAEEGKRLVVGRYSVELRGLWDDDEEDSMSTGARRLMRLWAVRSRRNASEDSLPGSVCAFSLVDDFGERRLKSTKSNIGQYDLNLSKVSEVGPFSQSASINAQIHINKHIGVRVRSWLIRAHLATSWNLRSDDVEKPTWILFRGL